MTLFVHASAVVALAAPEVEGRDFADRIDADGDPIWSPLARWAAVAALCRSHRFAPGAAQGRVDETVGLRGFRLVAIGDREGEIALQAYQRYGRGSGHPARLNLGDCFAYACAKTNGARLLSKGNDFAQTDLA